MFECDFCEFDDNLHPVAYLDANTRAILCVQCYTLWIATRTRVAKQQHWSDAPEERYYMLEAPSCS